MVGKKPNQRRIIDPWMVTTLILGIIITYLINQYIYNKKTNINKPVEEDKQIIAPYYTSNSFEKPPLIQTPIPKEAQLRLPIIMYHYVEYVKDAGDLIRKRLDITPDTFERQLVLLKQAKYETYFVKDVPDILAGNIYYAPKSVVLTFDDGYEDFYRDVFPLLKKYQMRATIYVIYDYIGRHGFLTQDEIIELSHSSLVEIGSHTLDHLYLSVTSKATAQKQIVESKQKLEALIGMEVKSFAYPYGAFNQGVLDLVKEASYSAAVSVIPGVFQSENNLFYLFRIRPGIFGYDNVVSVLEKQNK
jgi:peptidoglycan/xylan/chitin deacetylase (PgdA/CDA1 family)